MYSTLSDHVVEDLVAVEGATVMKLSSGLVLRFDGSRVDYGRAAELENGVRVEPDCCKNIEIESCTFDFIKSIAVGKQITSAGDFGTYIEFGLDQCFNLGFHADRFKIFSTETPIEDHR